MTAAIVGFFLLHHFDAAWYWYVYVAAMALLEAYHSDRFRNRALKLLGEIRYRHPSDED